MARLKSNIYDKAVRVTDPGNGMDSNRATIKDVYEALNDTRQEVMDHIDGLGTKFDQFVTSNEHRLTILETHQSAQAEKVTGVLKRLDAHGVDIGTIKDKQREDEAAQRALQNSKSGQWTHRTTVITICFSALIAAGAILALLHV